MGEYKSTGAVVPTSCTCKSPASEVDLHQVDDVGAEPDILNVKHDVSPNFHSKRALVSGPLTELGKKIISELCKQGAKVIALGGQLEELSILKNAHPQIQVIPVDLRNWKQTEEALSEIPAVDFLVNCAEFNAIDSVVDVKEEDADKILDINLKVINVSRLIAKSFIKHSIRGSIVNVSSQASKIGLRKQSLFCASKAGLDGYTRAAALELASLGIRINCVNPTVLTTELKENIWSDVRMSEALLSRIPLKKFCKLQEVVDAIIFLLSDNASFITGICLSIDGGISSS
ncbi:L-xylulose reductase-like isoform X2 [Coccinella septempunctata]|uniref:L-xylulose reductase-like isoform X2 n=1 Tax=Coccinella septempunctata TaxID=41139 RepID=UPI001D081E0F|nr:L-xylulose reductase-like isoform X2 [Coccinella septempunctata]